MDKIIRQASITLCYMMCSKSRVPTSHITHHHMLFDKNTIFVGSSSDITGVLEVSVLPRVQHHNVCVRHPRDQQRDNTQGRDVDRMLVYCWSSDPDAETTVYQHSINVSRLPRDSLFFVRKQKVGRNTANTPNVGQTVGQQKPFLR